MDKARVKHYHFCVRVLIGEFVFACCVFYPIPEKETRSDWLLVGGVLDRVGGEDWYLPEL
jgi:hypothetical protein